MAFRKSETGFSGLWLIEPDVMGDARGWFMEAWNEKAFAGIGLGLRFVQDNVSFSRRGILRGMHYQAPPHAQGKLVSVIRGAVLDVVTDIRRSSSTYGKSYARELNEINHEMLYIPPGFAHGFLVLSEECLFSYKCTGSYHRESEGGLMWNDPALNIGWGATNPQLSAKDTQYPSFEKFQTPFE